MIAVCTIIKCFNEAILLRSSFFRHLPLQKLKVVNIILMLAGLGLLSLEVFRIGSVSGILLLWLLILCWVKHSLAESFTKTTAGFLHQTVTQLMLAGVLILLLFCPLESLQVLNGAACII
jgi:hypothetical protein